MIKAVIFDVDGVLIDSYEANLKFYQDLFIYAGYPAPSRQEYQPMFAMTMKAIIKYWTKLEDESEIDRIWHNGKDRIVLYPDHLVSTPTKLEEVISHLKKKYQLAIVTSRITGGVTTLPQLVNIIPDFQTIIYFEDTEKHKPEPEPLLLAAERLNVLPEEAVYIGDMPSDIAAAKAAGMKAIAYSSTVISGADATTYEFGDLPEITAKL